MREYEKKKRRKRTTPQKLIPIAVVKKIIVEPERKKVITGYVATYTGPHKHISLSPRPGKVVRGVPFKVDRDMANALRAAENYTVKEEYKYVDTTQK